MKNFLIILCFTITTLLSAQDFTINTYDIDLIVNSDGSIHVQEDIQVSFDKKKRGIYRTIPTRYKKDGNNVKLGIENIFVEDHKSKIRWKNGVVEIRIGSSDIFVEGTQDYQIRYTIQNGIQAYENNQELYCDLTGNDWQAEIQKINYKIHLPKSIGLQTGDLKATTGYKNKLTDGININQSNSTTIEGTTHRVLKEGEGASIAINLPKTYLSVSDLMSNDYKQKLIQEEKDKVPQNPWLMLIPVGLLGVFFRFWNKIKGNKNELESQESYAYPPEGLTSAHVGAYIDQTANTRDIVSLIPYWASEGFLNIKNETDGTILIKKKDLPASYPNYEHTIFSEIFKDGDERAMEDLKEKFYSTLSKAKDQLSKEVHSQGYYKEEFVYWFRTWRLVIFPMLMFTAAAVSFVIFKQAPFGIAAIVIGVIGLFFGFGKLPLSEYGNEIKYKLDGLKNFLKQLPESEVSSILMSDPKYFEKMLPFAVAFGIDKNFIPKFEKELDTMPIWYHSSNQVNSFSSFQSSFDTETISSAFSSAPQTSSTGSSGGGGFSSGGGIGGGGGGSW